MAKPSNREKMLGGRGREWLQRLRSLSLELWRDKAGFIGVLLIAALVFMALAAPLLAPHDPGVQDLRARLKPPAWFEKGSWDHVLGTDHLGRDVLSRVIYGSRVSLLVGAAVVMIAGVFGVVMGLLAGYRGGRTDNFIMRWIDTQVAFPGLLLALIILAVIGPSMITVSLGFCSLAPRGRSQCQSNAEQWTEGDLVYVA